MAPRKWAATGWGGIPPLAVVGALDEAGVIRTLIAAEFFMFIMAATI